MSKAGSPVYNYHNYKLFPPLISYSQLAVATCPSCITHHCNSISMPLSGKMIIEICRTNTHHITYSTSPQRMGCCTTFNNPPFLSLQIFFRWINCLLLTRLSSNRFTFQFSQIRLVLLSHFMLIKYILSVAKNFAYVTKKFCCAISRRQWGSGVTPPSSSVVTPQGGIRICRREVLYPN